MMIFLQNYFLNLEEYILAGGIVMFPLIIISLLMWGLIINRAFFFRQLYRKNISREMAGDFLKSGIMPDPKQYKGAIAYLVTEFLKRRSNKTSIDSYILDETVLILTSSLNRYLSIIGSLAAIAPLLGLLGTVIGMVTTFDSIAVFGTGNAKAMAGGISEALITTQTGLLVAIPGFYFRNLLVQRANILQNRISSVGIYLQRYV